ncbi:sensor histidine kinase [Streptococcus orisasini]
MCNLNLPDKQKKIYLILSMLCFIIIGIYFLKVTIQYSYIGISADYEKGNWVIRQLHSGGQASEYDLKKGDIISQVNNQDASKNYLLNKWLIVEQASSVTISRKSMIKVYPFKKDSNTSYLYVSFSLISFILLIFSYIYFKGREFSQTSHRFYLFLLFTSLFLISVIPSSLGDTFARFIVLIYIIYFPVFIDIFWRAIILQERLSQLSLLSKIVIIYSCIPIVLFVYSQFNPISLIFSKFLSRGIFYFSSTVLIFQLIFSIIKYRRTIISRINIILLVLLCILPLFVGYAVPTIYNTPFIYVVPLLILPIIVIINELIINRLVNFRYRLRPFIFYTITAILLSGIFLCLSLISNFFPLWIMVIYTFLLILCLIPTLSVIITGSLKTEYNLSNKNIFSAVEMEREEISTYIHDGIIQDIIFYKKQVEAGNFSKEGMLNLLDDAIFDLRELCSNIYPLMIQELGLKSSILDIVKKFQKKETVNISVDINVDKLEFGAQLNNFILRSIKEMINNSILHGRAKEIMIKIQEKGNEFVIIEIEDDGSFTSPKDKKENHFGLDVISEKLVLLNGRLEIQTNPTRISMYVPREKIDYDKDSNN